MAPEQALPGTVVGPRRRHLRPGRDPLRIAHGPAAVQRAVGPGDAGAGPARGADAAVATPARLPARPGNDLPEVPAQGTARRYAIAEQLADDLQRFLDGEPIHARPVGGVERLGKWLRRRPAVAASIGLGSLAALAVVALAVRLVYSWELEDANRKLGEAAGAREAALVVGRRGAPHRGTESPGRRRRAGQAGRGPGARAGLHYVHSINLAHREWQANRVDEARRILDACPPDLRHWEWHYLYRQCHAEFVTIRGLHRRYHGPGRESRREAHRRLPPCRATPRPRFDLKIWDAASGKLAADLVGHHIADHSAWPSIPTGLALRPRASTSAIRIWDVKTGKELHQITGREMPSRRVAFSPDGTRLAAVAGSQIRFFDAGSGTELFTLSGHAGNVVALAFSADGQRLVTAGADRLVKLWDLATGKEVFSRSGHPGAISDVAFSPKQDQIISCGTDRTAPPGAKSACGTPRTASRHRSP